MGEKVTVYNNSKRVIRYTDKGGRLVQLMPGANLGVDDELLKNLQTDAKDKFNRGELSLKQVETRAAATSGATAFQALKEKDQVKLVAETFDVEQLKAMLKQTDSEKVQTAIQEQLAKIQAG